jgi:adenylylsulfate kinase
MQHQGLTVWFTGLSGAGKTTISQYVGRELIDRGYKVEYLDGDVIRQTLTKGLGFSKADRDENIRRIGFVAHLLTRNGVIVLVAVISPYQAIRQEVRDQIGAFMEVYVDAPVAICQQRDVKGLYKQALDGKIANFTGVDAPYEPPLDPEVVCHTECESIEASATRVLQSILGRLSQG